MRSWIERFRFLATSHQMTFTPPEVNTKVSETPPTAVLSPCLVATKRKREMTPEWKALVIRTLADNKKNKRPLATLAELARHIDVDKRGIYVALKTDQSTSEYVDGICAALEIDPPLVKPTADDDKLRALPARRQALLFSFVDELSKALLALPPEQQAPIRKLISNFFRDFFADAG